MPRSWMLEPSSVCVPSRLREFFGWSLELLIQRMEMDPKSVLEPLPEGHQKTHIQEVEEMDPNRFESVLEPLPEGHRKRRIREVLLSKIEGEQDLKQIVAGKTNQEATAFFERNFALDELDASALAGVVLSAKGKYFSSLSSSSLCLGFG
jgi:hypothetical protein